VSNDHRHSNDDGSAFARSRLDLHGGADYKRELTRVFARRALAAAVARAEGRALDARYPHAVIV